MNTEIKKTEAIIYYVLKREWVFTRLFRFAVCLLLFLSISFNFGYLSVLSNEWVTIVLAVLCAFVPLNVSGYVGTAFIALNLMSVSTGIALFFLLLWFLFFIIAKAMGAKGTFYLSLMTSLFALHIPFLGVVFGGFFGRKRDCSVIIGGSIIAFYMRTVGLSEAAFKSSSANVDFIDVIRESMLSNLNFYTFIFAVSVMLLLIYMINDTSIKHAWYIAGACSVVAEFLLMLVGYLFTGQSSQLPMLGITSAITLAFAMLLALFFGDIKVKRRKTLDFEDDEYYYRVVCTPKVSVEHNEKRVLRITQSFNDLQDELILGDDKEEE